MSYSQQIVWDLFANYVAASQALGIDQEYRAKVSAMQAKLVGPQIGKWGQLQEWMTDRDDPNDHHRHTSHLFALHPGRQMSPLTTPKLAEAAKVTLNARGDTSTGWSKAWKINFWARLHDGDRAHGNDERRSLAPRDIVAYAIDTELKRRGVQFTMEPNAVRPGLKIAFVRGPENIRIDKNQKSEIKNPKLVMLSAAA